MRRRQSYDDIRRHLEFLKSAFLVDYEGLPGLTIHMMATIGELSGSDRNYLLTIGTRSESDCVSVFGELHDLARQQPARLKELVAIWQAESERLAKQARLE